jgi:hypothetical protein
LTLPDGPAGVDGQNAYTVTTAAFTVPAIGSTVSISVSALGQSTGLWAQVGQIIFIEGAGYYEVVSATATVIVAENLGYTGNAAPTTVIALGAGVSPGGIAGVNGTSVTGPAGQSGTTQLVTLYSATAVTATSFTPLHTQQSLPSSVSNPLFSTSGDVLRVHFTAFCSIQSAAPSNANYWRYELEFVLDGVSLILPLNVSGSSYAPFNGLTGYIDIVAWTVSPLLLIVDVSNIRTGFGVYYNITNGYSVLSGSQNVSLAVGNAFASGRTSGVGQSANVTFQINGRRVAVGTPGGNPSLFLPVLKVERLKK